MLSEDATPLSFAEAETSLRSLLQSQGWPHELSYLPSDQAQWLNPAHVAVLRPGKASSDAAIAAFHAARAAAVPVELCAVASAGKTTFISVRVIDELGKGEAMFIQRGTKIQCRVPQFKAVVIHSSLYWRFLCWRVSRYQRRALKVIQRQSPPPEENGAA